MGMLIRDVQELTVDFSSLPFLFPHFTIEYWRLLTSASKMVGTQPEFCTDHHLSCASHPDRTAHYRHMSDSTGSRQ